MELIGGFDLAAFIRAVGYLGLFGIIFAESGLFLGFFLPGDSLLFTAGFLASQGFLEIPLLVIICFAGAVAGDSFGYAFGRRTGLYIFRKEDSLFFRKSHLERAALFYERHGGKTLILARFLPVFRTFAPILAGVGRMRYPYFLLYNVIGGALWAIGLTLLGYYLGSLIPNIDRYIVPLVFIIIILSSLPPLWHIFREKEHREEIKNMAKKILHGREPR